MNANFLKNLMDIHEFLAVKDLCTGLSRTESDYSEDELDQDLGNFNDVEDIPASKCSLWSQFDSSTTPLTAPSIRSVSCSDTDESRLGENICSAENQASLSSSESLTSVNCNENGKPARKKRKIKHVNHKEKAAPRKRSRTSDGANACPKSGGVRRRNDRQYVDESAKDDKYWERRRKNNQAAKRSRDLRREKEMVLKERAAYLEEENRQLREEVQKLKEYLKALNEK